MATSNDSRSPGARSGLDAMIVEAFGEQPKPTLTRAEVMARVEQALMERNVTYDRIDISDVPIRRNALSDAAGRRVRFPEGDAYDRCFVALVDLNSNALWAHPALWAFVPADDREPVELRETSLPEHPRGSVRLYAEE